MLSRDHAPNDKGFARGLDGTSSNEQPIASARLKPVRFQSEEAFS